MELTSTLDYGDLIKLAENVSRWREWAGSLSKERAFELAYDAIVSHVLTHEEHSPNYLAGVARTSIRRHLANRGERRGEDGTGHGFAQFWMGLRGMEPDHAPAIIDNLGVWQTFEALTEQQRGDLAALASTLNVETAAQQRGLATGYFRKRVRRARRVFLLHWFAPERPAPTPRIDNKAGRTKPPTGFKHQQGQGVTFDRKSGKWVARAYDGGKRIYLGRRRDRAEALELVDQYWRDREDVARLRLVIS